MIMEKKNLYILYYATVFTSVIQLGIMDNEGLSDYDMLHRYATYTRVYLIDIL